MAIKDIGMRENAQGPARPTTARQMNAHQSTASQPTASEQTASHPAHGHRAMIRPGNPAQSPMVE
uniref:hypothetical protein n=1 Tax=Paracoccus nototheniae TaxID=2489002 RepID=UPI001A954668